MNQADKLAIILTPDEFNIIQRGLLELPAKMSLAVISSLQNQVKTQLAKSADTVESMPAPVANGHADVQPAIN